MPEGGGYTEREENNKQVVLAFYEAALNRLDYDAAAQYLGPEYRQHNPNAADGRQGLKAFVEFLRANHPHNHSDVTQVFVDGDFVILRVHNRREPGSLGNAIVDIFRLDGGLIVEHWDSVQPIPAQSANHNTMF
jgi:predicted SnoaL-like aldol condensation-catalyzing enzyme